MPLSKLCRIALFAIIFASGTAISAGPPEGTAAKISGPVKLDGKMDDPAWESAPWQEGFRNASPGAENAGEPQMAQVQTRFKAIQDGQTLYLGIECDEPNPSGIITSVSERDGMVYSDDCVEIFFDPENNGRYYAQIAVNSRGTIFDLQAADYGIVKSGLWNGAFNAAGSIDANAKKWTVELAIPFGAVTLNEKAGPDWLFNVTRERYAGGRQELSSWAPLKGSFHDPKRFGILHGLPEDYSPFRLNVSEPKADISTASSGLVNISLSVPVKNNTGKDISLSLSAAPFASGKPVVSSPVVSIAKGAEALIEMPPMTVPSGNKLEVVLVFTGENGMLLRSVVKTLSTEYRPLSVKILRPCYRNCIFSSENIQEIVFSIAVAPDVRRNASALECILLEGGRNEIASVLLQISDLEKPVAIPVPSLPEGDHILLVRALDKNQKGLASVSEKIRKLPPPSAGNEVRIDENRNILLNGKPFFGVGWYGDLPVVDIPEVATLMNIVTPLVIPMRSKDDPCRKLRENLEKRGAMSVVSVENGRLRDSFELWRKENEALLPVGEEQTRLSAPSESTRKLLKELVEKVRGEPGLIAYYISDEPEIHNVIPEYIENLYKLLVELDPYHPVMVTNNTIDGIVTHGYRCSDILNPDPYSPNFDYVPNFLKKANEVAGPGQAICLTPWLSSGQAHTNAQYGTEPPYPYAVFRNQYFAGVAYGAKAFTGYISSFFMPETEYRFGLPHVWRELFFLEPAILAPAQDAKITLDPDLELATWQRSVGDRVYLILVNHKPGSKDVSVHSPLLKGIESLLVMSEGRSVKVSGGKFQDHFAEGDVHIYTNDPAAADFPTTASITAELAQRAKACVKPGNLLHWSRGTQAVASPDFYAPWFPQFFYYAINGITDDLGWNTYSWNGKSAWLELSLPQPVSIGRVEIHTPNFTDYDLDFHGPDGQIRHVEIRGNNKPVAIHRFRPSVPCSVLRITVRSFGQLAGSPQVLQGIKTPVLSEIEAYAESGEGPDTPVRIHKSQSGLSQEQLAEITKSVESESNLLWKEDFANFAPAGKFNYDGNDKTWVLNPKMIRAVPREGGGIICASVAQCGYGNMSHFFPYDPAYRFLQIDIQGISGEGYRFISIYCGTSSGLPGYRRSINTSRPGIYTIDTHYISENFRSGRDKSCFIIISPAGSSHDEDGTVRPGPEFNIGWLRLVRQPRDGLAVTLADGSPLPETLKKGETLMFVLRLAEPAADAYVEILTDFTYDRLKMNGNPNLRLQRADAEGRIWAGTVTLGEGTDKFQFKDCPVLFRAVVGGGKIRETYSSAGVSFE